MVNQYMPRVGLQNEMLRLQEEQMRVRSFLMDHRIAISFKWRNATYGYYASHEETNEAWAEVLRAEGYVPPKWWQVLRWGEKRAPNEVLAILKDRA